MSRLYILLIFHLQFTAACYAQENTCLQPYLPVGFYESGEFAFRKSSKPLLDSIAEILKKVVKEDTTRWKVEIIASVDCEERSKSDSALALRRAEFIKDYLVSRGVDEKLLIAKGNLAPYVPCPENSCALCSSEQLQLNRRFTLIGVPLKLTER